MDNPRAPIQTIDTSLQHPPLLSTGAQQGLEPEHAAGNGQVHYSQAHVRQQPSPEGLHAGTIMFVYVDVSVCVVCV